MFTNGPILARQVQGQIVCIPKKSQAEKIGDYRPLTLLNADYKILARIIANRLKPLLQEISNPHQHCGIPGTTVFDAAATIRDAIAYAEMKKVPLCAVSLDFQSTFDKISHNYLQEILLTYGFGNLFVDRIMGLYKNAASEVQINGFRSNPIPIRSSIRQGCPLSMQLYNLCLNPLLHKLDEELAGVRIRHGRAKTVKVAYADDVTVLLTTPDDVQKLQDILHTYDEATGAKINIHKSRALDVGGWDTTRQIMNITYLTEIKILGLKFGNKINIVSKATWCSIITQVRAAAQDAYYRELSLDMRIQYVHNYLLAKIWYAAQSSQLRQTGSDDLPPLRGFCGGVSYSECPSPLCNVGEMKEDGDWSTYGQKADPSSYTEYKHKDNLEVHQQPHG